MPQGGNRQGPGAGYAPGPASVARTLWGEDRLSDTVSPDSAVRARGFPVEHRPRAQELEGDG
ncbi:hypothetical protein GCM10009730_11680 [Streptomyces albidochromogenes]